MFNYKNEYSSINKKPILQKISATLKTLIPAILLILLFTACKVKSFDYRDVKNVKVQQLGFDKTALSMDLVYYNPNSFGVNLKHVDCDVYIDNSYLGKFQLDTLMHIDRKSEFTLPSKIMVDMKSVFKNVFNVLFSNDVLVKVKGNTRVGKAGVYITVPFTYEGRHKVQLFN
jgi:LEA14-like dessication related protein